MGSFSMGIGHVSHHRGRRIVALIGALALPLAVVTVTASPAAAEGTVTVTVTGQGRATGTGIDCTQAGGPDCTEFYPNDSDTICDPELKPPCHTVETPPSVEITAGADSNGFVYDGWSGCDSVSGRVCNLTVYSSTALTVRFRDAQAPTVAAPTPSSGTHGGSITLASTAGDNDRLARVDFRVRGVRVGTDTTAPYSIQFDTHSVADGAATLQAVASDPAGNVASSSTSTIVIDNTAPELTVNSGPAGETFGPGTTQTWDFTASDAIGLANLRCSIAPDGAAESYGTCGVGTTSYTVSGLSGGSYAFSIVATDHAGNTASVVRRFTIDALQPTVTRLRPRAGSRTRDRTPKVSADVADLVLPDVAGTLARRDIRLSVDGKRRRFGFDGSRVTWQAGKLKRGRHRVHLTVTDAVGNRTSKTWSFRIVRRR